MLFLLLAARSAAQEDPLRAAARFDSEQNCAAAEQIYRQVLSQGTPSQALPNNAGNHYLVCGDADKARIYFERLTTLNPGHRNANLQLARLAAGRREGTRALEYLAKVDGTDLPVRLLRAEALHWAGKTAAAISELEAAARELPDDPGSIFQFGVSCARIGAYERAEAAFTSVLAARPDDFDVLLNLGRAAARAGHAERA